MAGELDIFSMPNLCVELYENHCADFVPSEKIAAYLDKILYFKYTDKKDRNYADIKIIQQIFAENPAAFQFIIWA